MALSWKFTRGTLTLNLTLTYPNPNPRVNFRDSAAYNSSKCYLGQITLFIRCQYSIGLQLWLGLCLMYK